MGRCRTIKQIAVPSRIPSGLLSVAKTLGSGFPSNVNFPVSLLPPFKQSI